MGEEKSALAPRESTLLTCFCSLPGFLSWLAIAVFHFASFESSAERFLSTVVVGFGQVVLLGLGVLLTLVAAWADVPRRQLLLIFVINSSFGVYVFLNRLLW